MTDQMIARGRAIMQYIDEQAEAMIADGVRIERVEMGMEQFHALRTYLHDRYGSLAVDVETKTPPQILAVPLVVVTGSLVRLIPAWKPGTLAVHDG